MIIQGLNGAPAPSPIEVPLCHHTSWHSALTQTREPRVRFRLYCLRTHPFYRNTVQYSHLSSSTLHLLDSIPTSCSSRACIPPHSCNLAADVLNAAAVLNIQPRDPTRFCRGLDPTIAAAKSACPCVAVFRTTHHTASPPLPTPFFLLKPFLSFASPRFAEPSWCCHFMFFAGVKAFGPGTSFA